jgi:peptidylprolyl isomerase
MRRLILGFLLASSFAGAGCGGGTSTHEGSSASRRAFKIPMPAGEAPIRYEANMHPNTSGLVGKEPKPVIPEGPPPKNLVHAELISGIGDIEAPGEKMMVQYLGYEYGTGRKFVSSWDQGAPFTFRVGRGEVIPGWEKGLEALEGGDRRILVIPPELTNGPYPPHIPEDTPVVFLVERLPDPKPDGLHGW